MSAFLKKCRKCNIILPACKAHFPPEKRNRDGFFSYCRPCDRVRSLNVRKIAKIEGRIKPPDPEKSRLYSTKSRLKDIEKSRMMYRKSQQKRLNDPSYRVLANAGRRVRSMISGSGSSRHLPFTKSELISHLENLFKDGMTWENYGEWHVDHILPVSLFKVKNEKSEDFLKCWSLSNLQPLWAFENMSKGNKISTGEI